MNKYIKYIILIGCLFIFVFITINVYADNDMIIDNVFYNFIDKHLIGDNMTKVVKIITWFGSGVGIILLCIFSLFIFKDKKINISMVIHYQVQ